MDSATITDRFNWLRCQYPFIEISTNDWSENINIGAPAFSRIIHKRNNSNGKPQMMPISKIKHICKFINDRYSDYLLQPLSPSFFTDKEFNKDILRKQNFEPNAEAIIIRASQYNRMMFVIDSLIDGISYQDFFINLGYENSKAKTLYYKIKSKSITSIEFLRLSKAITDRYRHIDLWFILIGDK